MMIIGVDYHPSFQAMAFCVEETGEWGEQELTHCDGQAERFSVREIEKMIGTTRERWHDWRASIPSYCEDKPFSIPRSDLSRNPRASANRSRFRP